MQSQVNITELLDIQIKQGSEDTSASLNELGFTAELQDYGEFTIRLKFIFDSPLSISIGKKMDKLVISFLKPELFVSKNSGKTIATGTVIT